MSDDDRECAYCRRPAAFRASWTRYGGASQSVVICEPHATGRHGQHGLTITALDGSTRKANASGRLPGERLQICAGCNVRGVWEHRCWRGDGGTPRCDCPEPGCGGRV